MALFNPAPGTKDAKILAKALAAIARYFAAPPGPMNPGGGRK